ncbi:YbfB/YjiJ family MFS transporter [Rubeoparvulum massiliense]|uniref:YbfB/YjiJ family MFS transporter n=1 Tax=Rubeoparvulum massiliense TaxID=1631346 RepID=UPI0009E62D1A|nr:YbfB/YjiJ family MFS transporter [Rubeoparvulum massiliense]
MKISNIFNFVRLGGALIQKPSTWQVVLGGVIVLAIVMGISRFAYTPLLPLMQESSGLTDAMAGFLASSNYLGYLLGALAAGWIAPAHRLPTLRLYLVLNILSTFVMGCVEEYWIWFAIRFLAGLTSGLVFVLASSMVLDHLVDIGRTTWSGLFYGGTGLGILITGLLVPVLQVRFFWSGTWIGFGIISFITSSLVFYWLRVVPDANNKSTSPIPPLQANAHKSKRWLLPWLLLAYGLEGFGYIISGTFLVALIQTIPTLSFNPAFSWALVGLAAIPSCYLWALVAKHWGNLKALVAAYLLQIIGVLLPILAVNATGILLGSALFGATFMGITTLSMAEARSIAPGKSNQIIGYFTAFYGVGQLLGPAIAGLFITQSGSYTSSLILAACGLGLGLVLLLIAQWRQRQLHHLELTHQINLRKDDPEDAVY